MEGKDMTLYPLFLISMKTQKTDPKAMIFIANYCLLATATIIGTSGISSFLLLGSALTLLAETYTK
jgi:hypothetical protein